MSNSFSDSGPPASMDASEKPIKVPISARPWTRIGRIANKFWLLLLLCSVIFSVLPFISLWPIWDAGLYAECLYNAINQPFSVKNFVCSHSSSLYLILLSIPQYIFGQSIVTLNLTALVLMLLAVIAYHSLVIRLFRGAISNVEACLASALFAFCPVILSQVLFVTLDFGATILPVIFFSLLIHARYAVAGLIGTILVFTKEVGIVFYFCSLLFYLLFYRQFFVSSSLRQKTHSRWAVFFPGLLILLNHVSGILGGWGRFLDSNQDQGKAIKSMLLSGELFQINLMDSRFQEFLAFIGILNFHWIYLLLLLFASIACLVKNLKKFPTKDSLQLDVPLYQICMLLLLAMMYAGTRILYFANARYLAPAFPWLLLLVPVAVFELCSQKWQRIFVLSLLTFLTVVSNFRTFDTVSLSYFKSFMFGEHKLLKIGFVRGEQRKFIRPGDGCRDSLVYNLEFLKLTSLVQQFLHRNRLDSNSNLYFGKWNHLLQPYLAVSPVTKLPVPRSSIAVPSALISLGSIEEIERLPADFQDLYYFEFPNGIHMQDLQYLRTRMRERRQERICEEQYCVLVRHFTTRQI